MSAPQYIHTASAIAARLKLPIGRVRKALKPLPHASAGKGKLYDGRRAAMAIRREWPNHFSAADLGWLESPR